MKIKHKLQGTVWLYQGDAPWHFVTISKVDVDEIKKEVFLLGGFRSIKVKVSFGNTTWQTSIFPDKNGSYVLPLKKSVRILENIKAGDKIKLVLQVVNP